MLGISHFLTYQQDTPKFKPFGGDWKLLNLYCVQVETNCCAVKPHSSSQLVWAWLPHGWAEWGKYYGGWGLYWWGMGEGNWKVKVGAFIGHRWLSSCGDSGLGRLAGKSHPAPPIPLGEIWFGTSQFIVIIVIGSSSSVFVWLYFTHPYHGYQLPSERGQEEGRGAPCTRSGQNTRPSRHAFRDLKSSLWRRTCGRLIWPGKRRHTVAWDTVGRAPAFPRHWTWDEVAWARGGPAWRVWLVSYVQDQALPWGLPVCKADLGLVWPHLAQWSCSVEQPGCMHLGSCSHVRMRSWRPSRGCEEKVSKDRFSRLWSWRPSQECHKGEQGL